MRGFPAFSVAVILAAGQAVAQDASPSLYGMPGLIEMPTAGVMPDGQMTGSFSTFSGISRVTAAFQIMPALTGSLRYSKIYRDEGGGFSYTFDRSLDIHYRFLAETRYRPAMAIGLRDFAGTGFFSSEYVVATKHIGRRVRVTGGIGWGRMGTHNGFSNPLAIFGSGFNTRPTGFGLGGVPAYKQWFRGPAAFFGGVEWQTPVKGLTLKAEYSSDAYQPAFWAPSFTWKTPINLGAEYQLSKRMRIGGYYLYGSAVAVNASVAFNPGQRLAPGSAGPAPTPVFRRPRDREPGAAEMRSADWQQEPNAGQIVLTALAKILAKQGVEVLAVSLEQDRAEVRFHNKRYNITSQAIGRVARVMTKIIPGSVETFVLTPVEEGMPVVSVTLQRRDLEDLENDPDGIEKSLRRAKITEPGPLRGQVTRNTALFPRLSWDIGPRVAAALFDPGTPLSAGIGVTVEADYTIAPGLSVSIGAVRNLGKISAGKPSDSLLPHVRSDVDLYARADTAIEYLTGDYFFRPGPGVYGRVSGGYLERMFAGVSAEVLWKPVNSRIGIGVEANYVRQRDPDSIFGLRAYGVATGHVTAYYDMANGMSAQLDVGRYLAGDTGATVTVERRFDNGWRVGAFATLTNVDFATFGEGSFDKGLKVSVPFSWLLGRPNKTVKVLELKSLSRDGGAKLEVRNRLWPMVSGYHTAQVPPQWARFWR